MAINYICKGAFVIDVLAILPFNLLGLPILRLLSAIKLVRILRVNKLIKKCNVSSV